MAFASTTASGTDRQRSPIGLTLNLSSNNPFRNRATSPSPHNSPFLQPSPKTQQRPMSRNPFLDDSDFNAAPVRANAVMNGRTTNHNNSSAASGIPDDIFSELSLLDKPIPNLAPQGAPARSGTLPPQAPRTIGSEERRAPPRPSRGPGSPGKAAPRPLQRRASESSVMEKERRPRMDRVRADRPERSASEERRRRERRKEREERHRMEKEKTRNGEKRPRKPQGLDIIDKLDVTGIYGQGLFHHDGPFDACNPHRNAKKDRRAPMQAFPVDSANMQLGGAGPLRSRLDLDKFHGRGEEGFSEYANTRKAAAAPIIIDPKGSEYVHGQESFGLGTSTFLEGAPASKNVAQRRASEDPEANVFSGTSGGLTRKKSLAQRFRGMSGSRRNGPGDTRSPESRYHQQQGSNEIEISPPIQPQTKAISAGGPVRARYNKENEVNVFDTDYEAAFEKKGTQIRIAERERRPAPPPPQHLGLSRSLTSDNANGIGAQGRGSSNEEERPSGGGFLSRMRSLKGGPRRGHGRNES